MQITPLSPTVAPPMDLLLLADDSQPHIDAAIARGSCHVARDGGEVLGVVVLVPTRPLTLEITHVAVRPSHQGQGIGKALVSYAVAEARRAGATVVEIGTGNCGIGQLALYQKCGFRIVAVDVDYFTRHCPEEVVEYGIVCRDMIRLRQELA